jgi:hypothetical protein
VSNYEKSGQNGEKPASDFVQHALIHGKSKKGLTAAALLYCHVLYYKKNTWNMFTRSMPEGASHDSLSPVPGKRKHDDTAKKELKTKTVNILKDIALKVGSQKDEVEYYQAQTDESKKRMRLMEEQGLRDKFDFYENHVRKLKELSRSQALDADEQERLEKFQKKMNRLQDELLC